MTLVTQTLWGAAFCGLFGAGFEALRASTLVAGLLAVVAVFALLRQCRVGTALALVGALTLAANPVFFSLSYTFMTDVLYVGLAVLATLLFHRALGREGVGVLAAATLVACLATLVRQLGLVLPVAFAAAVLVAHGVRRRTLVVAALPIALVFVTLRLYELAVDALTGLPANYEVQSASLGQLLGHVATGRLGALRYPLERSFVTWVYLGLFALPVVPLLVAWLRGRLAPAARRRVAWGTLLASAAVALGCAWAGWLMPLAGNVLVDFGLGARTLAGAPAAAPAALWGGVTFASALGACVVSVALALVCADVFAERARSRRERLPELVLLLGAGALHVVPTWFTYLAFFDRYVMLLVPFLCVPLLAALGREGREAPTAALGLSGVLLAMLLAFDVAATHDYLAWSRVRQEAADALVRSGAAAEDVDGGFEWNSLARIRADLREPMERLNAPRAATPWRLAFGEEPGYVAERRLPSDAWLPWGVDEILVLRRAER